jgi:ankyrin repeat protein
MATSIENAMFMAAKAGYVDDIKEILSLGKGDWNITDALGNTPLHYAAAAGHVEAVRLLVSSKRVDINKQNNIGETPLHKAAAKDTDRHVKVALILADSGAKLDIKNQEGKYAVDVTKNPTLKDRLQPRVNVPDYNPEADIEEALKEEQGTASDEESSGDES